ncbi:GNAT family N-acetyltransferase [Amycolatopsis japonica]
MTEPPAHGSVVLREFTDADVRLALELGEDPYIPLIGGLPAHPTRQQAEEWVRRQRRRRGYATDALKAITEFAWTVSGVERIELYIEPWNRGSLRAAEKADYRCEGLLPAHHEIGGVLKDMLLYVSP